MNLRHSRENIFIKRKGLSKIKKILPTLLAMISVFLIIIIVMGMNLHSLSAIKKIDEQLNENEKLAVVFENLDQKKELLATRKNIINHLEARSSQIYEVMEELERATSKIELAEIHYRDEKIKIIGHCQDQEEIGEFCKKLTEIRGLSRTKIGHITNLRSSGNSTMDESNLIWEFTVEGKIKEKHEKEE